MDPHLLLWSVKWKEAQKCHYCNINKKKSARHSLTGHIAIAHHLNNQISKEKGKYTGGIAKSNFHLFFVCNYVIKLQSGNVFSKINWLEIVCLACVDYEEPDTTIIHQSITQRTQIQEFLHTMDHLYLYFLGLLLLLPRTIKSPEKISKLLLHYIFWYTPNYCNHCTWSQWGPIYVFISAYACGYMLLIFLITIFTVVSCFLPNDIPV